MASQVRHSLLSNPKKFSGLISPQLVHWRPSAGGASKAMLVVSRTQHLATKTWRSAFSQESSPFPVLGVEPGVASRCSAEVGVARSCFDLTRPRLVGPWSWLGRSMNVALLCCLLVALRAVPSQAGVHVTAVGTTNQCHGC